MKFNQRYTLLLQHFSSAIVNIVNPQTQSTALVNKEPAKVVSITDWLFSLRQAKNCDLMQCFACATSTIKLALGAIYGIEHSATRLVEQSSASATIYSSYAPLHLRTRRLFSSCRSSPAHPSTERDDSYLPFDSGEVTSHRPLAQGVSEASKGTLLRDSTAEPSTNINANNGVKDASLVTEGRIRRHPSLQIASLLRHRLRRRTLSRNLKVTLQPGISKGSARRNENVARCSVRNTRPHSANSDTQNEETGAYLGKDGMSNFAREPWQVQKQALSEKFGSTGWAPRKRLSPDALEGIRALHTQYPETYTTPLLAQQFQVSPEAIRRILKGKWRPTEEEEGDRLRRWDKRGEEIWSQLVEIGIKPPKKWRHMGVGRDVEDRAVPKGRTVANMRVDRDNRSRLDSQVPTYAAASNSASESLLSERIL